MTFLELHQFMKEDSLLYYRIKKLFPLKWQQLEKEKYILNNSKQVILVKQGLLVQEKKRKNTTSYCRMFTNQQIIFSINGMTVLRALEDTVYSVISTDMLFDELEEQKLLSNLFLQLQEDLEKDWEQEQILQWFPTSDRVDFLLQLIIKRYQLTPVTNTEFPSWLKIETLARFVDCSAIMVSRRVKELANKGLINAKSEPWRLLQTLPEAIT
ncbi:Crp/Fnr family transcriptional regulator [Listeria monocytogenes]|nr:Crp/Fnr family transcriptional regulator [Listeria monocytogenes]EAE8031241.1 Crp/Fnr family transcriptional regulator [Listeria monocytogenes]EGU9561052.1 Crp/Fnr family transcriptional regulator [Listeria monocytogenes]EKC8336998.1 Crp/Fnr family transcriptional regulator [Listeria monocytogenes]EKZ3624879.1 Crp/Fnr family transcriptional regulator [Listeria monocytogenes]